MSREKPTVAAAYCCVAAAAAAVCASSAVVLAIKKRRHGRNQGRSSYGDERPQAKNGRRFSRDNSSPGDHNSNITSRGGALSQTEGVFALFDESDGEQLSPPMTLSDDVQLLLRSFDVDPVRGMWITYFFGLILCFYS